MVIKIIKVIISKEVITSYPMAVKKANPEVIILIKTLKVPEVPEAVLGKPIGLLNYLILISFYYSSIEIITPLKA